MNESILKAYQFIPEAYRQTFRNYKKEYDKTHVEFGREEERLMDRWCASEEIRKNVNLTLCKRFMSISSLRGLSRSYTTNLL